MLGRILLAIGFFLSFLTNGLILSIVGGFFAIYTYVISIVLRGVGWISLRRSFRLNLATGLAVLILGLLLVTVGLEEAATMITLWVIYTFFEAASYLGMTEYSKVFYAASVNVLSAVMGIYLLLVERGALPQVDYSAGGLTIPPPIMFILVVNMISALAAMAASLTIKKEVQKTTPPP